MHSGHKPRPHTEELSGGPAKGGRELEPELQPGHFPQISTEMVSCKSGLAVHCQQGARGLACGTCDPNIREELNLPPPSWRRKVAVAHGMQTGHLIAPVIQRPISMGAGALKEPAPSLIRKTAMRHRSASHRPVQQKGDRNRHAGNDTWLSSRRDVGKIQT